MIIGDQPDRGVGRIGGVEKLEEFDEFAAAMAILDQLDTRFLGHLFRKVGIALFHRSSVRQPAVRVSSNIRAVSPSPPRWCALSSTGSCVPGPCFGASVLVARSVNFTPSALSVRHTTRDLRTSAWVICNMNSSGTVLARTPVISAPPFEKLLRMQVRAKLRSKSWIVAGKFHSTRKVFRRSRRTESGVRRSKKSPDARGLATTTADRTSRAVQYVARRLENEKYSRLSPTLVAMATFVIVNVTVDIWYKPRTNIVRLLR
jgi:hypothetical protein